MRTKPQIGMLVRAANVDWDMVGLVMETRGIHCKVQWQNEASTWTPRAELEVI
jgi:hypothetical protein